MKPKFLTTVFYILLFLTNTSLSSMNSYQQEARIIDCKSQEFTLPQQQATMLMKHHYEQYVNDSWSAINFSELSEPPAHLTQENLTMLGTLCTYDTKSWKDLNAPQLRELAQCAEYLQSDYIILKRLVYLWKNCPHYCQSQYPILNNHHYFYTIDELLEEPFFSLSAIIQKKDFVKQGLAPVTWLNLTGFNIGSLEGIENLIHKLPQKYSDWMYTEDSIRVLKLNNNALTELNINRIFKLLPTLFILKVRNNSISTLIPFNFEEENDEFSKREYFNNIYFNFTNNKLTKIPKINQGSTMKITGNPFPFATQLHLRKLCNKNPYKYNAIGLASAFIATITISCIGVIVTEKLQIPEKKARLLTTLLGSYFGINSIINNIIINQHITNNNIEFEDIIFKPNRLYGIFLDIVNACYDSINLMSLYTVLSEVI